MKLSITVDASGVPDEIEVRTLGSTHQPVTIHLGSDEAIRKLITACSALLGEREVARFNATGGER